MSKYDVEYETKEQHTVTYEIQAQSIEEVQQMIDDGTFYDNATLKYDLLQSSDNNRNKSLRHRFPQKKRQNFF